jgi:hypothetical protein
MTLAINRLDVCDGNYAAGCIVSDVPWRQGFDCDHHRVLPVKA